MFNVKFLTKELSRKRDVEAFITEWNGTSEKITVKTSGSTGVPKEITLDKVWMIHSANSTCDFFNLTNSNSAALCLSIETIGGLMMIVRAIIREMTLLVYDVNSNPIKDNTEQIDFIALVPMQVSIILQESKAVLEKCRNIIIGGAPINNQLLTDIQNSNINAWQTFGMTETISHIALKRLSYENSTYELLENIEISTSQNDCLIVNAPLLGVYNLQTNDCIKILSPKEFTWTGRLDYVINSGGIKLHPEEIELKLASTIDKPFFIFGLDDPILGSACCIAVESKPYDIKLDFKTILSKYEVPKKMFFFSQFERGASDKINRALTLKAIKNAVYSLL